MDCDYVSPNLEYAAKGGPAAGTVDVSRRDRQALARDLGRTNETQLRTPALSDDEHRRPRRQRGIPAAVEMDAGGGAARAQCAAAGVGGGMRHGGGGFCHAAAAACGGDRRRGF